MCVAAENDEIGRRFSVDFVNSDRAIIRRPEIWSMKLLFAAGVAFAYYFKRHELFTESLPGI